MELSPLRPNLNSEFVSIWARIPLFWRCQLLGWLAFIVLSFPLRVAILGGTPSAVLIALYRDALAFSLTTFVMRVIYRELYRRQATLAQIVAVVLALCLAGGLAQLSFTLILHQFGDFDEEWVIAGLLQSGLLLYFSTTVLLGWSLLYFGIKLMRAAHDRELRLAKAESERREAELQMLRAQINPHFLFNALNTIRAKAEGCGQELKEIVQSLADYLRYSLEHRGRDLVLLGEEYKAMMSYLAIEKSRFQDKLIVDCQIEGTAREVAVPGIVLQPLVENAVKYGRQTSSPPLKIKVRAFCPSSESVRIEVSNTGSWTESRVAEKPGGVGLENLKRRLELLYPDRHTLEITNNGGWVTVSVCLPTCVENEKGTARADS